MNYYGYWLVYGLVMKERVRLIYIYEVEEFGFCFEDNGEEV